MYKTYNKEITLTTEANNYNVEEIKLMLSYFANKLVDEAPEARPNGFILATYYNKAKQKNETYEETLFLNGEQNIERRNDDNFILLGTLTGEIGSVTEDAIEWKKDERKDLRSYQKQHFDGIVTLDWEKIKDYYSDYESIVYVSEEDGILEGVLKNKPSKTYVKTIITENWKDVHKHLEMDPATACVGIEKTKDERHKRHFDTFEDLLQWIDEAPEGVTRRTRISEKELKEMN